MGPHMQMVCKTISLPTGPSCCSPGQSLSPSSCSQMKLQLMQWQNVVCVWHRRRSYGNSLGVWEAVRRSDNAVVWESLLQELRNSSGAKLWYLVVGAWESDSVSLCRRSAWPSRTNPPVFVVERSHYVWWPPWLASVAPGRRSTLGTVKEQGSQRTFNPNKNVKMWRWRRFVQASWCDYMIEACLKLCLILR